MDYTSNRRHFFRYATMSMLSMLGLSCYILADTFFVSRRLGADGLTALNLAIPIYSILHGCGLMLGMGGAIRYAVLRSRGKMRSANAVFTAALCAGGMLAVLFALTGLLFSSAITRLLGADQAVFAMTETYLRVILLFSPAFLLNDILLCFVRNDGNPRLSMLAMVSGSMANILLDYLFLFPLKMGIGGAVLATGLAPVISLLLLSAHWRRRPGSVRPIRTHGLCRLLPPLLSLGFPSLVTELSSAIVMLVFNSLILSLLGNVGVAAYGVIANLSLVVLALLTGIAQGAQPLLSQAYGEHNQPLIHQLLRYAVVTVLLVASALYTLLCFGASPIVSVFNSERNELLQQLAVDGMRLYFSGIVFAGLNILLSTVFAATERGIPAHILSLLRGLLLIIPFALLLAALWGITGIWLAFPAAELLTAAVAFLLYVTSRKRIMI